MKTTLCLLLMLASLPVYAATSINPTNKYAYGANFGWIDWRGDTNNGAVIGEYVCSGYIYGANVGWISLGNGAPANNIRYRNDAAADFGVNHDGQGNLSGYAYGANIGWITFTNATAVGPLAATNTPRVDLKTGKLSGYAYSANCGWISLSNAFAYVQTETIPMGADTDGDGIADAWELTYGNTLNDFGVPGDADGDGFSDLSEYLADTNPDDAADYLQITFISHGTPSPTYTVLQWTSRPSRCYAVQNLPELETGLWADAFLLPAPGVGAVGFDAFDEKSFYRIRAFRPLAP